MVWSGWSRGDGRTTGQVRGAYVVTTVVVLGEGTEGGTRGEITVADRSSGRVRRSHHLDKVTLELIREVAQSAHRTEENAAERDALPWNNPPGTRSSSPRSSGRTDSQGMHHSGEWSDPTNMGGN